MTWKDVDPNIYITNGFTPPKHHHIMDQYVRFIGDAVALVVAETEDIALEAMKLIDVTYTVLKPVFTIEEALAPDAPQLYPEFPGNIAPHKNNINFEVGDVEKGFEESDVIVEVDSSIENGQNPLPVELLLPSAGMKTIHITLSHPLPLLHTAIRMWLHP